jgi:hypothetical protein
MRTVLISGIPATGKTRFGEWLAHDRGFLHLDLETSPLIEDLLHIEPLAFIDKARAGNPDMVITWGFPPNPPCVAKVREFRAAGLVPWWFDGDRAAALESYRQRPDYPGTDFYWDLQLAAIEQAWPELVDLYDDRRIDVISPGPTYLDPEEIFSRMFA